MPQSWGDELREQGRGIAGALLVVGVTFLYTMETWWWGWTLPTGHLLVYALVGLGVVLAITRKVSFREPDDQSLENDNSIRETLTDFADLVLQSFVAAYAMLLTFGIIELDEPLSAIARLRLMEVVPLGFGAALANKLFAGTKQSEDRPLSSTLAIYATGAIFVAGGLSPTQEIELLAAYMGWTRGLVLIALSVFVSYLMLYELELRGQEGRLHGRDAIWNVGHAFLVYAVAVVVGTALLAAFGHFIDTRPAVMVQMIVVVSFPTSVGASAAQVVI
ncbi:MULTISPECIES: DUF2391 family protein [Halorussus]|uniref:DUF2391 family protein n=1 Tax=Halorussus TaxID=1070314 RepID=UPI0020A05678|nr:DUF2391 family protein [Halorussus vallis]USZ73996.1 TIGR02587 family membrane protein [Halorussus vallis]